MEGHTAYACYDTFRVENETAGYKLEVSGYSGTAGDSMRFNNQMQFSTFDRDSIANCNRIYPGGWWHNIAVCTLLNPNGIMGTNLDQQNNVFYNTFANYDPLKQFEMHIIKK